MQQNKRRSDKLKRLDSGLSFTERFFHPLALRRFRKRLLRFLLIAAAAAALLYVLGLGVKYALDKAYGLNLQNIEYTSRHGFIGKEAAMRILGITDSVNVATLNTRELRRKLEEDPSILSAHVRAEYPRSLYVEVEERIPIVYVEMREGTDTGNRAQYFMAPDGFVFPKVPEFHENFEGVPIWYLNAGDVPELKPGIRISREKYRPIVQLVSAANAYGPTEIPRIEEIFRNKDWRIDLTLESGTTVMMQVLDIKPQIERLRLLLDNARARGRRIRSANVIPSLNPVVIYADPAESR